MPKAPKAPKGFGRNELKRFVPDRTLRDDLLLEDQHWLLFQLWDRLRNCDRDRGWMAEAAVMGAVMDLMGSVIEALLQEKEWEPGFPETLRTWCHQQIDTFRAFRK